MLTKSKPDDARKFVEQAQQDADTRWQLYQYLAAREFKPQPANP
jgi:pyruvate-ferredoxin/flavodoxin oxidoreductase